MSELAICNLAILGLVRAVLLHGVDAFGALFALNLDPMRCASTAYLVECQRWANCL